MSTIAWPHAAITGTLRVYVAPSRALEPDQADELHAVLGCFLEALRLRMFPGTLATVHGLARGDDGKVDARFDVVELDLGALRVLHGMLSYVSVMVAPLGTMMVWCEPVGSTPNLFDVDAPLPKHRHRLPFEAALAVGGAGASPPLSVEVTFGRALTDDEKDRFERELRVWVALVHGGYPEDGDPQGSSAMGPVTVRYDGSDTLRLHAEAFLAGDACFEPLMALVAGWASTIPVVRLETE